MRWEADWLWGLPVIVVTIAFHIVAFVVMERRLVRGLRRGGGSAGFRVGAVTAIALGAIALHALEAIVWAALYLRLGALPDVREAILYSLSAITAYGHAELFLQKQWQLLGAMEAMNGVILFGLTTAFLFAAVQLARPDRDG